MTIPTPNDYVRISTLATILGWKRQITYYWIVKCQIPIVDLGGVKHISTERLFETTFRLRLARDEATKQRKEVRKRRERRERKRQSSQDGARLHQDEAQGPPLLALQPQNGLSVLSSEYSDQPEPGLLDRIGGNE